VVLWQPFELTKISCGPLLVPALPREQKSEAGRASLQKSKVLAAYFLAVAVSFVQVRLGGLTTNPCFNALAVTRI